MAIVIEFYHPLIAPSSLTMAIVKSVGSYYGRVIYWSVLYDDVFDWRLSGIPLLNSLLKNSLAALFMHVSNDCILSVQSDGTMRRYEHTYTKEIFHCTVS